MPTPVTSAQKTFLDESVLVAELMHVVALFPQGLPILQEHGHEGPPGFQDNINVFVQKTQLFRDKDELAKWFVPVWTAKAVDNFNCYLSDVLTLVLLSCPDALKSKKSVTYEEVLDCPSRDDVVRLLATKAVDALGHKGFDEVKRFLTDRLGISVSADADAEKTVREAIAVRNIVVHNRGRVNARFLQETGMSDVSDGGPLRSSVTRMREYLGALEQLVEEIDEELIKKFHLAADDG